MIVEREKEKNKARKSCISETSREPIVGIDKKHFKVNGDCDDICHIPEEKAILSKN